MGNLIIGYNESRVETDCPDGFQCNRRGGSHNLVIGYWNNYPAYGGMVAGAKNEISGGLAMVTGGSSNTASGVQSSVSGGVNMTAAANYCTVADNYTDC